MKKKWKFRFIGNNQVISPYYHRCAWGFPPGGGVFPSLAWCWPASTLQGMLVCEIAERGVLAKFWPNFGKHGFKLSGPLALEPPAGLGGFRNALQGVGGSKNCLQGAQWVPIYWLCFTKKKAGSKPVAKLSDRSAIRKKVFFCRINGCYH